MNEEIKLKDEKEQLYCYDCGKEIEIKDKELVDAKLLIYDDHGEKIAIVKCNECYKKNPSLTDFRGCEVYSRIVGYLRPINQWHASKQEEYKERKNFKV